jgi:hypothetical protein
MTHQDIALTDDFPRHREEFQFRYSPYADTEDGILMAYLKKGNGVKRGKELVLDSVRAFWMVAAYQAEDNSEREKLQRLGLSCCLALQRQADYIRQSLQLPITASSCLIGMDDFQQEGERHPSTQTNRSKPVESITQKMWQ